MKIFFFLLLTLMWGGMARLYRLGTSPPLFAGELISHRILSVATSIGGSLLVFLLAKKLFKNERTALLSAFVFTILPWSIEQGRIGSQPSRGVFSILFLLYLGTLVRNRMLNIIFYSLIPFFLYFIYPTMWIFSATPQLSIGHIIQNIFFLMSPEQLFFKDIVYLSFMPFFLIGMYRLLLRPKVVFLLLFGAILLFAALSPKLPESQEFFLSLPLLSMTISFGISRCTVLASISSRIKILLFFFLCFFMYESAQYIHFFMIHYPQQIQQSNEFIKHAF